MKNRGKDASILAKRHRIAEIYFYQHVNILFCYDHPATGSVTCMGIGSIGSDVNGN
jgi:hypothetical protein